MQIRYRSYASSQDPTLNLFANFILPGKPCPILVSMHGWHGQVKNAHADNIIPHVEKEWFVIEPEMRGRGDSTGRQDANGWELNDVVDAVEFAKKEYASLVSAPDSIYLVGGSGGGGNVLGLSLIHI